MDGEALPRIPDALLDRLVQFGWAACQDTCEIARVINFMERFDFVTQAMVANSLIRIKDRRDDE